MPSAGGCRAFGRGAGASRFLADTSPTPLTLCDREVDGGGPGGGPGRGLLCSQCLSRDGDLLSAWLVAREEELAVDIIPAEAALRALGGIIMTGADEGSYWDIGGLCTFGGGTT